MNTALQAPRVSSFVVSEGGPVVPHRRLTLPEMERRAAPLDELRRRADVCVEEIRGGFGPEGLPRWARWRNGLLPIGADVTAALGAGVAVAGLPDAGLFEGFVTSFISALSLGVIGMGGLFLLSSLRARRQVELRDVALLETLHGKAPGEVERAVIGNAAQRTLSAIANKGIYRSDEVARLLEGLAGSNDPERPAIATMHRHRRLLAALRRVETQWFGVEDRHVLALADAIKGLTPEEHRDLAPELRDRLFEGTVPKRRMSYDFGERLRAALQR